MLRILSLLSFFVNLLLAAIPDASLDRAGLRNGKVGFSTKTFGFMLIILSTDPQSTSGADSQSVCRMLRLVQFRL